MKIVAIIILLIMLTPLLALCEKPQTYEEALLSCSKIKSENDRNFCRMQVTEKYHNY